MDEACLNLNRCRCAGMQKLDQHRQKCVSEGRYSEAKAAASRLADLKTAQVGEVFLGGGVCMLCVCVGG